MEPSLIGFIILVGFCAVANVAVLYWFGAKMDQLYIDKE